MHFSPLTPDIDVVMVVMCCCFLLPTTLGGESQSFPHAPMMCAVSVILANDCHVFFFDFSTGNAWNISVSE